MRQLTSATRSKNFWKTKKITALRKLFRKADFLFDNNTKETLINTFLPFFKMSSKAQTRTFFKTAKRTLRFNQRILNKNDFQTAIIHFAFTICLQFISINMQSFKRTIGKMTIQILDMLTAKRGDIYEKRSQNVIY